MGKLIRIDEYRRRESRSADADHDVWSCGACGESAWTVSTSGHLRCRHCDTLAANLQVADEAHATPRDAAPDRVAPLPWMPLAAPAPWWWTWARQQ